VKPRTTADLLCFAARIGQNNLRFKIRDVFFEPTDAVHGALSVAHEAFDGL